MDTAFNILVISLSCLLGIFLILSICVTVVILKLVGSVRRVVAKGEELIGSAEEAAEMFKKAAGPVGAIRTLTNIVEAIIKHSRGKD